jgi:hypothetical protein
MRVGERLAWALAFASVLVVLLILVGCTSAQAACVSDYHRLSGDHGYRRYRVVAGRHCWYADQGARAQATRSKHHRHRDPLPPPAVNPTPLPPGAARAVSVETPPLMVLVDDAPARRVERSFDMLPVHLLPGAVRVTEFAQPSPERIAKLDMRKIGWTKTDTETSSNRSFALLIAAAFAGSVVLLLVVASSSKLLWMRPTS